MTHVKQNENLKTKFIKSNKLTRNTEFNNVCGKFNTKSKHF